jgi:hypothetical protein
MEATMEPVGEFLMAALGYILKGAAQSKTVEKAKEELLGKFWRWVRPSFLKDLPEIEKKPETSETETKVYTKLLELVQDEAFFQELVKRVDTLQKAGIKEKNIVRGDIKRVRKIRIGDKTYSPDEMFDRKNIVDGSVEDADEFIMGDGH